MPRVSLRFYAELNQHLPPERRQRDFLHTVDGPANLGDVIAALDVPLGEIELLLVNGTSVDFSYRPGEGDRISVYPTFDAMDVGSVTRIETRPHRRQEFVLDVHLGKLAQLLRMLGFDALYRNDAREKDILDMAARDDRIVLSKSASLLGSSTITAGYRIRSDNPREQLVEVLERFDLWLCAHPFQRCLHCNTILIAVPKQEILDRLPEKVRALSCAFTWCPTCDQLYWEGTHVERMRKFMKDLSVEHPPHP